MVEDLTVVIPNYNNAKYIGEAVESIYRQTCSPKEIIIVDDCSTDDSRRVLEKLRLKYDDLNVIYLKENQGVSHARNKGLSMVKTEYVTFLDADDIYYNNRKLENEMSLIRRKKCKDGISYSITAHINEDGSLQKDKFNIVWKKSQFIIGNPMAELVSLTKQGRIPRDYCVKTEIVRRIGGYDESMNFYEDLDLLMRIGLEPTLFYCTFEYGTGYRRKKGGLSEKKEIEHLLCRKNISQKYFEKLSWVEKMECNILRAKALGYGCIKKVIKRGYGL